MIKLEIDIEQYEELKNSEYVHVVSYRKGDEVTRAWIEAIGTKDECEESQASMDCHLYIVPTGLTIHSEIVAVADIAPPAEVP